MMSQTKDFYFVTENYCHVNNDTAMRQHVPRTDAKDSYPWHENAKPEKVLITVDIIDAMM
jgi:hypothetical protein